MQTHLVPTSIKFHQGYPAAWQCRLIWNRAQGGRATIWVIWLLHRIEPTVLGLFPILSTKNCFCLHQTSEHQPNWFDFCGLEASNPSSNGWSLWAASVGQLVGPFYSLHVPFCARLVLKQVVQPHQGDPRRLWKPLAAKNVTMFHLCLQRKGYVDTSLWSLSTEV